MKDEFYNLGIWLKNKYEMRFSKFKPQRSNPKSEDKIPHKKTSE